MLSTYLAQLSEARSLRAPLGPSALSQVLKTNALLFGTMYVGATDLLCNPDIAAALSRPESGDLGEALLSGDAPLLQPVMYAVRSFEELADTMCQDGTLTPMAQDRAKFLLHARSLDALRPVPKVSAYPDFRYRYWQSVTKAMESESRQLAQPKVAHPARRIYGWLSQFSDADARDCRQSAIWRYIDTLRVGPAIVRRLQIISDTAYQETMAVCSHACLSLDVRFPGSSGKWEPGSVDERGETIARPTGAPDRIEEVGSAFPFSAVERLHYGEIAELARAKPFAQLRGAIAALQNDPQLDSARFKRLFDECADPMMDLAKKPNARQRLKQLETWKANRYASQRDQAFACIAVVGAAVGVDQGFALFLADASTGFLLGSATLAVGLGKLINSRRKDAYSVPNANFIAAAQAYDAILSVAEERQRVML